MRSPVIRRIISLVTVLVLLVSQAVPVSGNNTGVLFDGAAQYASTGGVNCFPDKGQWGEESKKAFYIKYDSDSGNEYKPVDGDSDFVYGWFLPLSGMESQIDNGLQYKIDFDVFGHILDFDYARVNIDFWVPLGEGITGYITEQTLFEDVDQWKHRSFSGYIPDGASYMRIRFASKKAAGALTDSDAAIFYRNIEVYLVDDTAPTPTGIEYGTRFELGTTEMRTLKDYYGVGSDVYWDVEFNEAVFVNDTGYLAHTRGLDGNGRAGLANTLAAEYPKSETVKAHVLNNNGSSVDKQFGELTLKFKYRNSDNSDHTGYATVVDRALYNGETYGNDYSKQIKFKYTVRPGDDFRAEDIYEMELVGGIITDNAYNAMPGEYRKLTFDSNTGTGLNTIFRKYIQNFSVETTAPVLLEINGRAPEGLIGPNAELPIYLKFSEPVYMTMSDEEFAKNNINKYEYNKLSYGGFMHAGEYSLDLNSKYVDTVGTETGVYGRPQAYYSSGNGTTMLKFGYYVHENKFNPLEVVGSGISSSGVSCGEIYVMDAAGNSAPLVQKNNVKLSDGKYYMADAEPPQISVQTLKAEAAKGGFYLRIDVFDKGEGIDYDRLRFGFDYAGSTSTEIWKNVKALVPGKLYHSEELKQLFGIDTGKADTFLVMVDAWDKRGNFHFSPKYGQGWYKEISMDTATPVLERCYVDNEKYSSELGRFTARFRDGQSGEATAGMGSAPNIKYKWVSAGLNPYTEDWQTPTRTYSAGMGYYYAEGPRPSGYIYGDADLYLKAVDLAGNETVHYVPKALLSSNMVYMNDRLEFDFQTWAKGRVYACKVDRFERTSSGVYKAYKGLWYCLTSEAAMPEFSETSGLWKYKDGNTAQSNEYDANPRERNGYYFMHVVAVDNDGKPIGAATSPTMLLFDFKEPVIEADAEKQKDDSWKLWVRATDDTIRREDIKLEYSINYNYDWKTVPANGEIMVAKELQDPRAWVQIRAVNPTGGYYNPQFFGPYTNEVKQLAVPYINFSRGNRYTNEDFVQLFIGTEAEQFSYSLDGTSWSSWLNMGVGRVLSGYAYKEPCVPLPDSEGEITFYTRYRDTEGIESPAVKSTVVRDVTPPTGDVELKSCNNSVYFYTAKPSNLKDNLCASSEIQIEGDKTAIIARGEPQYFVIKDAAGNKAELKAYMAPIPVIVLPDDRKDDDKPSPAPQISVSPNGSTDDVKDISVEITATDDTSVSSVLYDFSTEYNSGEINNWTQTANNSTVSLSGVNGTYYLHVKAIDADGNTRVFRSEPYYLDNDVPMISVSPNGNTNNTKSVSPKITVTDNRSIAKIEYIFSRDNAPASDAAWVETANKSLVTFTCEAEADEGQWYLHVRTEDEAGNTAAFTSASYNMVSAYAEPWLVYSGEEEGNMRAILASQEPITVTEAVYDLKEGDPPHTFNYGYDADGSEGSITTDWEFEPGYDMSEFKGKVEISPYNSVTAGPVKIILESKALPWKDYKYKNYTDSLDFWTDEDAINEGIINERLIAGEGGSIKILEGVTGTWNGYNIEIDDTIDESDEFYFDQAAYDMWYDGELWVFKVEITTETNGRIAYSMDDGAFIIKVGHIVDDEALEDNVKEPGLTYAPRTLLVSANRYATAAGMLRAYQSLSGADLTPPTGQVSYTTADAKKGPVTANLRLTDDSGGNVTITSSGGGSHSFDSNGQFVFSFVDEAGNMGRALAEVGTIAAAPEGIAVAYSTKQPTREQVKITMTPEAGITLKSGDAATVLENGSYSFRAADNGQWKFKFANEGGTETELIAEVGNIDRTPPKLRLEYIRDYFNKTVTAVVKSDEPIWAAPGSALIHVFKANGKQSLKAVDEVGNEAVIEAVVNDIEKLGIYKSNIDVNVNYSTTEITSKPVTITLSSDREFSVLNNKGRKALEVARNGKYQFIVQDSAGLIKIAEAEVKNIDTEAPLIKLGYPENTSIEVGEAIDLMNFTTVDNNDGDIKSSVKVEGSVNNKQPGTYQVVYTAIDSCGNKAVKKLTVKVLGDGEQIVLINGVKYGEEPLLLNADKLQVTAKGFSGPLGIKWTKGYETLAFFKTSGAAMQNGTLTVSKTGWHTIYVCDPERNSRLIHVYIDQLGGGQQ